MSPHKCLLFATLFTIVALETSGRVNVFKAKSDVPKPNTWLRAPMPAAAALRWYSGQPACTPGRWLTSFRGKGEPLPQLFVPIQFKDPKDLGVGKLLVSSRGLGDPNFAGTVVLLVHYDEKGVLGLILNRRTDVPLSQVLDLKAAKDRSDPVYLGGPMEPSTVFALFQSSVKIENARLDVSMVRFFLRAGEISSNKYCRPSLTRMFFTFTWDMPDGRKINCGPRCNWARGTFFRQTPPQYSIPIRVLCGCR